MALAWFVVLVFLGINEAQGQLVDTCTNPNYDMNNICVRGCQCVCSAGDKALEYSVCVILCAGVVYKKDLFCDALNNLAIAPSYPHCDKATVTQLCKDRCNCCETTPLVGTCVSNCENGLVPFVYTGVCTV